MISNSKDCFKVLKQQENTFPSCLVFVFPDILASLNSSSINSGLKCSHPIVNAIQFRNYVVFNEPFRNLSLQLFLLVRLALAMELCSLVVSKP